MLGKMVKTIAKAFLPTPGRAGGLFMLKRQKGAVATHLFCYSPKDQYSLTVSNSSQQPFRPLSFIYFPNPHGHKNIYFSSSHDTGKAVTSSLV
jgi:hypothetical protein